MERSSTLKEMFHPLAVRMASGAIVAVSAYDASSNQFGWPKIPALFGMTGSLLPWWGWLLVFQSVFLYALFDYVRRGRPATTAPQSGLVSAETFKQEMERSNGRMASVADNFGKRLEALETAEARLARHREQQAFDLDASLERLTKLGSAHDVRISAVYPAIEDATATLSKRMDAFSTSFGALLAEHHLASEKLDSKLESFRWVIRSVYNRENLKEIARRLEETAEEMSGRIQLGLGFDAGSWTEWLAQEATWNSRMYDWCQWAYPYMPKIAAHVDFIDPKHYEAAWTFTDDQFPNALAVHKYKQFRVRLRNWNELREHVMRCVHNVAFEGCAMPAGSGAPQ